MQILLDANILSRLCDSASFHHPIAIDAVRNLTALGHELVIIPQSLYEFWVMATRPTQNNGLGFSVEECDAEIAKNLKLFSLLNDSTDLFSNWRRLVRDYSCKGKIAHDSRYVAAMNCYGLTHILTFNLSDFSRFSGILRIDPSLAAEKTFSI
jgi:predicted nucleic acid-binding protein